MSIKKFIVGIAVFTLILTAGIASTYAYQDNDKPIRFSSEKHEVMTKIFEDNDYQAWEELMNEKAGLFIEKADRIRESINEENFNRCMEVQKLMKEGKIEEAKALKSELIQDKDNFRMMKMNKSMFMK